VSRAAIANVDPDLQRENVRTCERAGEEARVFLSAVAAGLQPWAEWRWHVARFVSHAESGMMKGMRFDAVLLVAFGGPQGIDDIRPFLANVLKGRPVARGRLEEVAHHYELFGGVSPITEATRRQAAGLEQRLAAAGVSVPAFVGMRNWHPLLADTLAEMSRAGLRRAIGFIMAAHSGYSSCEQYRENVREARQSIRRDGLADVEVTYVGSWHTHAGFIAANADHVEAARARLPAPLRAAARILFTAHSIPVRAAERSRYREQLLESARAVAERLDLPDWALVYQSRSGRPEDPWLGPDVGDALRQAHTERVRAVVLCPIGFVCDHIEVLYDLDIEAAAVAAQLGLALARAQAVGEHPRFLDAMSDAVLSTLERYASGRVLELVPLAEPRTKN
jgi:ferrochelatase